MKLSRFFLFAATIALTLASCHGDDDSTPSPDGRTSGDKTNTNANPTTTQPDIKRLEFPHVKGGTSEVIIHSTGNLGITYALEWDHELRAQRWTCFQIYAANRTKNWSRSDWNGTSWGGDPFQLDPKVPAFEQPSVRGEFSGSYYPGTSAYYQRGHICASEDRVYSQAANEQTFYMTNMMPQVGNFNGKLWANMEARVRTWGAQNDTLYVCKGGTIDSKSNLIGYTRSGFLVPRYFFMAVLAKNKYGYKAIAFLAEHLNEDHSGDNLANYVYNIDDLEKFTGLDFFCNLPDDVENSVESLSTNEVKLSWGFK